MSSFLVHAFFTLLCEAAVACSFDASVVVLLNLTLLNCCNDDQIPCHENAKVLSGFSRFDSICFHQSRDLTLLGDTR